MSRPGAKKRGAKSHHRGRKHPELSRPFPRDRTVAITSPGLRPGDDAAAANAAWFAWLRIVARLRPFA